MLITKNVIVFILLLLSFLILEFISHNKNKKWALNNVSLDIGGYVRRRANAYYNYKKL